MELPTGLESFWNASERHARRIQFRFTEYGIGLRMTTRW